MTFPIAVDSSLLASFKSCERKAQWESFDHWKPLTGSVDLIAGVAFASGLEEARRAHYERGLPPADAIVAGARALILAYGTFDCPDDSPKSLANVLGAFEFYFEHYPLGSTDISPPIQYASGAWGIEFSYATPLPILHPDSGLPLLLVGRADAVVHYAGATYLVDEKTTKSLGPKWPEQWHLRSQFSAYCWAARAHDLDVRGVLIRGVAIRQTGFDTLQALTYRQPWQLDEWLDVTCAQLERMIAAYRSGRWLPDLSDSCTSYGGCHFRNLCTKERPQEWITMTHEKRIWDPVTRIETKLPS